MAEVYKLPSLHGNEADMVVGMFNGDKNAQYCLYEYCAKYFYNSYKGVFRAPEDAVDEIFQNSFIKLWENIMHKKIYVDGGVLKGKDSKPMKSTLRTYFMGIARLKCLEWLHDNPSYADPETEIGKKYREKGLDASEYVEIFYSDSDNIMLEIIADVISNMSARCSEILTKFYYEEKNLDKILEEIPSIDSKNALKSKKYKCMETLKETAAGIYDLYLKENN